MKEVYYIGLDIHKKIIAYCIKTASGTTVTKITSSLQRIFALFTKSGWEKSIRGLGSMKWTRIMRQVYKQ